MKDRLLRKLLKFTQLHIGISIYIPKYNCDKDPNRDWKCNIVNSLFPAEFKEFIDKKGNDCEENIIKAQNLKASILS